METLGCGSPWCMGSISNQRVIQVDTAPEFEVIVSQLAISWLVSGSLVIEAEWDDKTTSGLCLCCSQVEKWAIRWIFRALGLFFIVSFLCLFLKINEIRNCFPTFVFLFILLNTAVKVLWCVSPGYCRRSWRLMFLCMLALARSEHTELYCWPELLMSFRDRRTKIPSSSICQTMSCLGSKISLGRSFHWVYMKPLLYICFLVGVLWDGSYSLMCYLCCFSVCLTGGAKCSIFILKRW